MKKSVLFLSVIIVGFLIGLSPYLASGLVKAEPEQKNFLPLEFVPKTQNAGLGSQGGGSCG